MSKFYKLGFSAAALMFVFGFFAAGSASAQLSPVQQIMNTMDTHNKSLTSLQADVKMVKHNPQLDASDTTSGTMMYLPKSTGRGKIYARIDWTQPLKESVAVIGNEYTLYNQHRKQVIKGKTDSTKTNAKAGGVLSFMSMSKAELKANYNVEYAGQENVSGGTPTWHLVLTPKKATTYKVADLWVDGNGMPVQAKVTENNGDSTTVLVSNMKKNVKLNAKVFTIDYDPKAVEMIKG